MLWIFDSFFLARDTLNFYFALNNVRKRLLSFPDILDVALIY